jgi:hypothetical protein
MWNARHTPAIWLAQNTGFDVAGFAKYIVQPSESIHGYGVKHVTDHIA